VGHGCGLQRNDGIKLPLAYRHAARVLPEMARQVLHGHAKLKELAHARMPQIEAGVAKLPLQRVARISVLPRAHQPSQAVEGFAVEAERLANFARRRASAISDDVGRHGRPQLAVALIDVLDDTLALTAAGEIEINIGPLTALLRQESLEQQFHTYWINSGDAK